MSIISSFGKLALFRNSKRARDNHETTSKHSRHFVKCTCDFEIPMKPCLWYHMSENKWWK